MHNAHGAQTHTGKTSTHIKFKKSLYYYYKVSTDFAEVPQLKNQRRGFTPHSGSVTRTGLHSHAYRERYFCSVNNFLQIPSLHKGKGVHKSLGMEPRALNTLNTPLALFAPSELFWPRLYPIYAAAFFSLAKTGSGLLMSLSTVSI